MPGFFCLNESRTHLTYPTAPLSLVSLVSLDFRACLLIRIKTQA